MMLLVSSILALIVTVNVQCAAIHSPLNVLTLNDISPSDREYLEYLENEAIRNKRSGDLLDTVKTKLKEGLKSKLSGIASASSHASSYLTGGSKHFHDYGTPHDEKSFNFWDLQKSIFHTLLQAAKAIKGGLLAIKGQLIKGSGYVISAKGKLISAKGEAISNIGKHLASTAILLPRPGAHYSAPSGPVEPVYAEPPLSSGYGDSSGPGVEYHSHHYDPVPSGHDQHKYPTNFQEYKDHHSKATNHGIVIIKKIPKVKKDEHKGNNGVHISQDKHKPVVESEEPEFPVLSDVKNPSFDFGIHNQEAAPPSQSFEQIYQSHGQPLTPHFDTQAYEPPQTHPHKETLLNLFTPHKQEVQPPTSIGHLGKLEVYDPFSFPNQNQQPLSVGVPSYLTQQLPQSIQGYENFPPYPVDLHKSYDTKAQYSTLLTRKLLPPATHNAKTFLEQPLQTKSVSRRKHLPNNKSVWLRPKHK